MSPGAGHGASQAVKPAPASPARHLRPTVPRITNLSGKAGQTLSKRGSKHPQVLLRLYAIFPFNEKVNNMKLESGMPSPPPLPSNHLSFYGDDFPLGSMIMIWQNPDLQKLVDAKKRNRAKWSVYHLLSGLQNYCGESGRKIVE